MFAMNGIGSDDLVIMSISDWNESVENAFKNYRCFV